jgi:aldehyde:ferredoxin oxidoreductase
MTKGPGAGVVTTDEELEYMKKLYYEYKGWTEDGLIPKKLLIKLGMPDVAEQIGV